MELINRIRKSRKGFTLVEIIVVLIILAILAAFTIPTMLGFVGDARGKAYIAEAREVYVAAQSTATEFSAKLGLTDGELTAALGSTDVKANEDAPTLAASADAAAILAYNKKLASHQMSNYIGSDLTIIALPAAAADRKAISATNSAWSVTVGATTATGDKTAKVGTLVYYKNGYEVTIDNGNASVVNLNK